MTTPTALLALTAPGWALLAAALAGGLASAAAAALLARLAPWVGWVDAGGSPRKLQRAPVPLVGGAALLAGLAAAALAWRALAGAWPAFALPGGAPLWAAGGLASAFLVGLLDDLLEQGLGPLAKLGGQAAAGAVCAAPLLAAGELAAALLVVLLALVAQNALNTFDNADGAAVGLGGGALLLASPLLAPAVLALLPFNLRRADGRGYLPLPRVFLGDAGSHLLGMLVLLVPAAWPALLLPLLDLARLCVVRARAGQPPWIGDRRHLAHRLEARGLAPAAVLALLLAIALPALALGRSDLAPLAWGATALLFAAAVERTRAPAVRARAGS